MRLFPLLAALGAAVPVCGQSAVPLDPPTVVGQPGQKVTGADLDWYLPLRPDPDARDTHWASGPTYKVRFDDGMTFFPVLGAAAPENLPLRWRTESIVFGGAQGGVPTTQVTPRASEWRYELIRPGVTEIYDVLPAGVEQAFVVARPAGSPTGDLVIRGRVESPLQHAPRAALHAPLRFADAAGRDVIEYGAAFAIDAAGRRLDITTSFRDGTIELRVPAAWLRQAEWPVQVDPLTSRIGFMGSTLGAAAYPTAAHDSTANRFAVTDARPVSASDYDLTLRLRSSAWSAVATLFSDLSTANTRLASISVGGFTQRWILAFQRQTAMSSRVRVYFHDTIDLGFATGVLVEIPLPNGVHDAEPSLAPRSGSKAFLAMRRDAAPVPVNTESSAPVGYLIDVENRTFGPARALHTNPGNNFDAEHISVSCSADNEWVVAWQEYNFDNVGDDWDVIAQRINYSGDPVGYVVLGEGGNNGVHKISPCVDGNGFDYLVSYLIRPNSGDKPSGSAGSALRVQRFGWPNGVGQALGPSTVVDFAAGQDLVIGSTNRNLAHAATVSGHWGLAWRRNQTNELRAARIGYDGGVAEYSQLQAPPPSGNPYSPSVCWDASSTSFAMVYASIGMDTWDPLYSRRMTFDSRAQSVPYGVGCAGVIAGTGQPYSGTGLYRVQLAGGRPSAPTVLLAGSAIADLPFPGGHLGCRLLVDPTLPLLQVHQGSAAVNGSFSTYLGIPSSVHDVHVVWQYVQIDQGEVWSSNGLYTAIY